VVRLRPGQSVSVGNRRNYHANVLSTRTRSEIIQLCIIYGYRVEDDRTRDVLYDPEETHDSAHAQRADPVA